METTDDKDMLSVPSELDTSWADQERDDEPLELEPMTDIVCWILYIDWEGNLEHVYRDKQILEEDVAGEGRCSHGAGCCGFCTPRRRIWVGNTG